MSTNNEGTPTPLTDAAYATILLRFQCAKDISVAENFQVSLDEAIHFARQLERDLTATKQRLEVALRCFSAMPEARPHDRKNGVWHLWTQGCDHLKAALHPARTRRKATREGMEDEHPTLNP